MTNQTPNNTQQIIIEFVAKTSDALKKWEELNKKTEEAKKKIQELAAQTGAPLKEVTNALKMATADEGVKNIDNLNQALKSMQDTLKNNKKLTKEQSEQLKASIADVTRVLKEEGQAGKEAGVAIAQGQQRAKEEAKGLQGTLGGGGGIMGMLKGGLAFGGGLIGITSIFSAFQKMLGEVVRLLITATNESISFTKNLFGMAVGVRALQRSGVDITMSEMAAQIESLRLKFGIFSRKDLVEGAAAFLNLNRDMGFTKEQLFSLQEAIATLAVVNGRSMDEVQKTVALALSSGYTEGLQRLGVSINRVTIAEEAARLGWEGGYTALNEQQRALATYNLVIEKTAIYQDDLLEYQNTLPGQIETVTKKIEDQTIALGSNVSGWKLWVEQIKLNVVTNLTAITTILNANAFNTFVDEFLKQQTERIGKLTKEQEFYYTGIAQNIWYKMAASGASIQQIYERYGITHPEYNPETFADIIEGRKTEQDKLMEAITNAVDKNYDDIIALQEDFQERSTELFDEYTEDIQEIWEEHWKKEKEIFNDWATDYLDARTEHEEKVIANREEHWKREDELLQEHLNNEAKAQQDYENSVADVWRQYNSNLIKAQESYRNRELDAEEKFQEQMRKLREGFLMDLEEAVRQRDARQVLTLIKRYNLDRKQAEREYDMERRQAWRDYQQQLVDLARQRDERLAQLYEELQQRFTALDEELKAELAKEEERNKEAEDKEKKSWDNRQRTLADNYTQRSKDEDTANDDRIKKRDKRYEEDLDALDKWLDDRAKVIGDNLASAVTLTDEQMKLLVDVLNRQIGPGSVADSILLHYAESVRAAAASAAASIATIAAITTWIGGTIGNYNILPSNNNPLFRPPKAKGGIEYAESATKVTYGEAGPELAMFIPLNRSIQGLGSLISSVNFGTGQVSKQSRAAVEISLAPGLEGRIVDTAADVMADVIIRRLR